MSEGYGLTHMAYVSYVLKSKCEGEELEFTLDASEESAAVHPAFVIKYWGQTGAEVEVDDRDLECGVWPS